ncbi:MAG: hypothetical protein D6712_12920 [Chloroflexi bacterium]|nr:MAG: hypothetical protein D6712_12920 [Chloroflexota bacterium]
MAVSTAVQGNVAASSSKTFWLRDRRWDLMFITLSVLVVPLPYVFYLLGRDLFGLDDDVSRNLVNAFVAIAVGGPHMMSTFLRTGLDEKFKRRYPTLIRSSIIIPIIVISLAFLNLSLLLTVFFFWASIHVLHQAVYIVELYRHKEEKFIRKPSAVSPWARIIDYAVILTCLFPIASYKIVNGTFFIGVNDLGRAIPDFVETPEAPWFFYLMTSLFAIAATAFIVKTVWEYRNGIINWPKTLFISFTVVVAFFAPALPNLDTAFQGMNTWHSFQYLAITFYIIKIRQHYGNLDEEAPLVARFSRKTENARGLYTFSAMLLVGSLLIFVLVYVLAGVVDPNIDGNRHFDIAYYTAILSFLWIHYYHDHFLFTDFEALDKAYGDA